MNDLNKDFEEEQKQQALAVFLQKFGIFTHCVDYFHSCHAKCRFHDPYGNGRYSVCAESLRVHGCRQTTRGTDPCLTKNDGFDVVCAISGLAIKNQDVIDVERNIQRLMWPNRRPANVKTTQKQRVRAAQMERLWIVLGDVIRKLFKRRSRKTYNDLPGNAVRHYSEITKHLWENYGVREFNIGTHILKIAVNSKYNLHLSHVRVSRLIALESKCRSILERALNTIETAKTIDFVCNHPQESCSYVVRCTLDGFRKKDSVLLDSETFADLAPMPTDKGLESAFGIRTKEITNCSLILQEALNKLN